MVKTGQWCSIVRAMLERKSHADQVERKWRADHDGGCCSERCVCFSAMTSSETKDRQNPGPCFQQCCVNTAFNTSFETVFTFVSRPIRDWFACVRQTSCLPHQCSSLPRLLSASSAPAPRTTTSSEPAPQVLPLAVSSCTSRLQSDHVRRKTPTKPAVE